MSILPEEALDREPDYLPARMVNEYVYCPRLFYYEHVQGVFVENADTVEGKQEHRRVDQERQRKSSPTGEGPPKILRSLTLSSERHRVIAKLDLAEVRGETAIPVDYKHGGPMSTDNGPAAWAGDRVQLAVQCLVLRDNGYACSEGIVFYQKTRQRVRLSFDDEAIKEAIQSITNANRTAKIGKIPPPLEDSPKCPGCSLVGICMPDETRRLAEEETVEELQQTDLFGEAVVAVHRLGPGNPPRLLLPSRIERKPLYVNTPGVRVGKSRGELVVVENKREVQRVRLNDICQVSLMGSIQLTTQAIQALCEAEIPICYFSQRGWFYGITTGLNTKNLFLRKAQFALVDKPDYCLNLARRLVTGKIQNQRTMLQRNHVEPPTAVLRDLRKLVDRVEACTSFNSLRGIEGMAARHYFGAFSGMIKQESDTAAGPLSFAFNHRNRRPPRDGVNALLSLAYSLLAKDLTLACYTVGFDPMAGFYHQPRHGCPALALDLMEPMRPLIADSVVLSAINTRMVREGDFVQTGKAVALTPNGRKSFFRAYELRMNQLVTHPLFNYRVSYRRLLEIQVRLLAKMLEGNLTNYHVFVTR
jgi:CRISPR-associated protein Cas1